jgi:hypothetical protein
VQVKSRKHQFSELACSENFNFYSMNWILIELNEYEFNENEFNEYEFNEYEFNEYEFNEYELNIEWIEW